MADPFKQVPARFLGHGVAIAEGLQWSGRFHTNVVDLCGAVGFGYVALHCIKQAVQAGSKKQIFLTGVDVLMYDLLASIVIPTFLVYHATRVSNDLIRSIDGLPSFFYDWAGLVFGLALLYICYPFIDDTVEEIMKAIRPLFK